MLHPDDRQTLIRMVGPVPTELEQEALLRTQLYHRAGNTGPLGVVECVNIVRYLGLGVLEVVQNKPLETYDFRTIKVDTTLWVKGQEGYYRKAKYVGDHPGGKVAVRYEGHKEAYGVRPVDCLLNEPSLAQLQPVIVDSPIEQIVEPAAELPAEKPAKGKKQLVA
jgi:hypothetical protein